LRPRSPGSLSVVLVCGVIILEAIYAPGTCAASELEIPKPTDALKPAPPPPALEPSVVNLDVRVSAEELADAVDQAFPGVIAHEDDWKDAANLEEGSNVRFLYRVVRGRFRYRMDRDRFNIWFDQVRYRIWAKRNENESVVEGRCGHGDDPPRGVNLAARSALSWSDRWRLQSQTTFDDPVFTEPCRLPALDLDATPALKAVLQPRLAALAEHIDRIVRERTEAKQRAETVWQKLQEPIEFAPDQWLQFHPSDARVSPITSNGTLVLQTSINLVAAPRITSGRKPETATIPLPPLQLTPLPVEGFHLALPISVPYARINQRLEQEMIGQQFQTPVGERLMVEGVQLYGSGDKLILALRVSGGMNGTLYATGTPVFEEGLGILRFLDLDFTVETRNVLVRSANWMFHQDILSSLRSQAVIDLSGQLQTLRSRLTTALARDLGSGARLEGEVTRLLPRGVYPTAGGVEVHIIADGSMWVELR
jgi:hypothetical protein